MVTIEVGDREFSLVDGGLECHSALALGTQCSVKE